MGDNNFDPDYEEDANKESVLGEISPNSTGIEHTGEESQAVIQESDPALTMRLRVQTRSATTGEETKTPQPDRTVKRAGSGKKQG